MNVVSAIATAYRPYLAAAALSANSGAARAVVGGTSNEAVTSTAETEVAESGATEPDGRSTSSSVSSSDGPLIGRYPREAYRLDAESGRLVTLFRNPADGSTVSQTPTQAALKQYKAALQAAQNGHPAQVPLGFGALTTATGGQVATGTKGGGGSFATGTTGVTPFAPASTVVSSSANTNSGANTTAPGSAPATGSVGGAVGGQAAGGVNLVV